MRTSTTPPAAGEVAPVRTSPADVEDRPTIVYGDDLPLAGQGWGPTMRAICLRLTAAVSHRIARRPQRSIWRSAAGAAKLAAVGAAAAYARHRGLL